MKLAMAPHSLLWGLQERCVSRPFKNPQKMSAATTSTFPTCKETKMLTRVSCLRELNAGTEKQPCCGNINSLQEG